MLGVGLLLFRLVVGAVTVSFAVRWIAGAAERTAYVWLIGLISTICGVMLVVGFMTLAAGVLASITIVAITFPGGEVSLPVFSGAAILNLVVAMLALGLAMTGPGAFSIEGRLYGRREIVVPPRERETSGER